MEKLFFNKSNPHILYIHSDFYQKMSNLENHLRNLHESSCGSDTSFCIQKSCNSYLVMYIDEITSLSGEFSLTERMEIEEEFEFNSIAKKIEDKYYKYISSFLTLEIFPDMYEIYNVCTNKSSRGKGIMKQIFKALLEDFNDKNIWLGVRLDNPFFNAALHLYASFGFAPIAIEFSSPHDFFSNVPFVAMIYKQNISFDKNKNEKKALEIVKKFNQTKGQCNINIYLDSEKIKKIYDKFIYEKTEYGGVLKGNRTKEGFSLEIDKIVKGEDRFTVSTPLDLINWHTHPFICFTTFDCFISWPSGPDFSFMIGQYRNGVVAHFLFTEEGVYFLQLNPVLMFLLRFLSFDCIENIANLVKYRFSKLEKFRNIKYDSERLKCFEETESFECYTYNNRVQHLSIGKMNKIVNTFTFSELLKIENDDPYQIEILKEQINKSGCLQKGVNLANSSGLDIKITNFDFPIFEMNFKYGNNAKIEGIRKEIKFFIPPTEPFCPN
jgi:GNAT superfamily N-acetyltransferase